MGSAPGASEGRPPGPRPAGTRAKRTGPRSSPRRRVPSWPLACLLAPSPLLLLPAPGPFVFFLDGCFRSQVACFPHKTPRARADRRLDWRSEFPRAPPARPPHEVSGKAWALQATRVGWTGGGVLREVPEEHTSSIPGRAGAHQVLTRDSGPTHPHPAPSK